MKAYVMRWTCVLFFVSMAIFQGALHAEPPEIIAFKVKDTYPGDMHDNFAQPGERFAISLEVILDFIPSEAYIICDSEFAGVESAITRFVVRKGDTLINTMLEPVLFLHDNCPTDFLLPFSLIYRKDTTYDTLNLEVHTVAMLDSCFLNSKVNKPGRKVTIRALCTPAEERASGYSSIVVVVRRGVEYTGDSVVLFDDGKHSDGAAGDGHFANSWWTLSNAYDYSIDIVLRDSLMRHSHMRGNSAGFTTKWFSQSKPYIIFADPYDSSPDNEVHTDMKLIMDSLDLEYDEWNIWYRGLPDSADLAQWGMRKSVIIWATKLGGTIKHSARAKAQLKYFLENGGRVFIATPYFGSYISSFGESADSLFLEEVLSAAFVSPLSAKDSTRTLSLFSPCTGQAMDTFTVSLSRSDSNEYISFIDVLHPIPPATPIVKVWSADEEVGDTLSSCGIKIAKDTYRAIYLTFNVGDIEPFSLRKDFLGDCLEWIANETADSFAYEPFTEDDYEFVKLSDPYPNPFLYESTIPFTLLDGGEVHLVICDLTGRTVRRLIHSSLNRGNYYAVWDGKNEKGEETAVGYYFVRLSITTIDKVSGEGVLYVVSKKLLKLRK
jgi:hypothetical protein